MLACLMDTSGGLWVTLLMALTSDPSDPEHSVEKSALEAANYYIRIEKPEYAIKIVSTLVDTKNRLEFYRSKGLIDATIEHLLETRHKDELYRVLKGNNRFEEGANIALKFDDIENHIVFVVLGIKAKLWTHDASYTEIEKQDDIQKLQLLEQQTHKYYTKEQINYCITVLKNNKKDYNDILSTSYGFMKPITFDAFLNAFKPKNSYVIPILKNLGFLLRLHKLHQEESDYVDVRMKIFYHIKIFNRDGEYKCNFPPIMLLKLHVNTYEIDIDGNVTMSLKELKELLDSHIRSIAKPWLKVLDKLLGKIKQSKNGLKRCVRVKNMIGTLHCCTNLISCKYYYEQFGVSYAEELDYHVTETMLLNVLSLPWICYIPNNHRTVEVLLQVPVIKNLFEQLQLPGNWAFQGNTKQFHDFKKFAKETIDYYSSSVPSDEKLASFISELEIITIGLLAAFSKINKDYSVIVPQSYEIVTQWFNEINSRRFFPLIRKPPIKYEEALDLSLKIIKMLLGSDFLDNILVRACNIKYPDHYPLQYQFERCLVLVLTLFGNLAPILEDDIKYLFQIRLQTINKLTTIIQAQNTSHPRVFRSLIFEAADAVTTNELFIVVYKIQKLYCRKMAKLDLQMKMRYFEVVEPKDFPSSLLYPADSTTTQMTKEETHNA